MIRLKAIRIITIRFFGSVLFTVFCSIPFILHIIDPWLFPLLWLASKIATSWTSRSFSDYHLLFIVLTENVLYSFSIIQIIHPTQPEISSALSSNILTIQFILWAFALQRTLMLTFRYRYASFWETSMDQNSMNGVDLVQTLFLILM